MDFFKMMATGRLGKDATVNTVNGKNVINFSVGCTTGKSKTTWIECAYWTDRTAVVPYLRKGTQVLIEGKPEADAYVSKDGEATPKLRLMVFSVQLLGSTGSQESQPEAQESSSDNTADDLPF